jgi:hypothetical protein
VELQKVYKVYSGKAGKCMCGCAGKYSYTADGAVEHNPGYQPHVSERSVKIVAGKVLRNPNKIIEDGMAIVEENGRVLVAYFAD